MNSPQYRLERLLDEYRLLEEARAKWASTDDITDVLKQKKFVGFAAELFCAVLVEHAKSHGDITLGLEVLDNG